MDHDSDNMDDEEGGTQIFDDLNDESNPMKNLLEKLDNVKRVLENAALTAALMNYIFHSSYEYFSLLYYFMIKKYSRINESKIAMRNYNHTNMEVFTVFVHPKSILQFPYKNPELFSKIEDNINSPECILYYRKMSKCIVRELIAERLDQFRQHILSGEETFSYVNRIHTDISKLNELNILDTLHKSIYNSLIRSQKSRCLPSQKQDVKNLQIQYDFQISALVKAMNTQYEDFLFSKRYSFTVGHQEINIPVDTFLSCPPGKVSNKIRIKGHCFEAESLSMVTFCLVCEIILWGPHPHCLFCRNCKKSIHHDCKEMVKICQIDSKRSKRTEITHTDIEQEIELGGQMMFDKVTKDLTKIFDDKSSQNQATTPSEKAEKIIEKPKIPAKPKMNEIRKHLMSSFDKTEKCTVKYTNSMNLNKDVIRNSGDCITRSKSARSPTHERLFGEELNKVLTKSPSEDSGIAASVEPLPTSQIESDEEMQVSETFKAEIELKQFTNDFKDTNIKFQANLTRRLVLMEFHHNIKFIRMTLKRFRYVLVDPWLRLNEHLDLFELMSLNCVVKLYKLIGSLVDVVDSCQTESTYLPSMAEKVLHWLSDDNEVNLCCWIEHSTNLCCTNSLQPVKTILSVRKQICPKLNDLISVEVNRILIINQLSNMRPLLLNLPMIVKKIGSDLDKVSQFKDEARIWKEVHEKFSRVPKLIDERCMPVVHMINDGIILPTSLKYKRYKIGDNFNLEMENYIKNFPSTIFQNDFVDFQFVKIKNLSHSYTENSYVYVKEETNAALICYEKEMIFLQTDGDKYVLKSFKGLGNRKLFPVIQFENIHVTKQTEGDKKEFRHQLSVLVINRVILAQVLFRDEKVRDMWFNLITKSASKLKKEMDQKHLLRCQNPYDRVDGNEPINIPELDFRNPITKMIRSRLSESVNQLVNTFDLITNELSTESVPVGAAEDTRAIGFLSPCEFIFGYMDILKEYAFLAESMINRTTFLDSSLLLEKNDIALHLSKLKNLSKQMDFLIQSQDQLIPIESESSSESTLENDIPESPGANECKSIHSYIEDVITEALNKIQYNSKSEKSSK